jgi:hypothetical protein
MKIRLPNRKLVSLVFKLEGTKFPSANGAGSDGTIPCVASLPLPGTFDIEVKDTSFASLVQTLTALKLPINTSDLQNVVYKPTFNNTDLLDERSEYRLYLFRIYLGLLFFQMFTQNVPG